MELKAVGGVSMGDMRFEVCWQIDNVDCTEWTFLWANTTTNTQALRDEGNLGLGGDFDTETTAPNHWTRLLALLSAFLPIYQCSSSFSIG